MTSFNIQIDDHFPELVFVEIDSRFDLAIERTATGLSIRVYPRTDGELWDFPFTTFEVDESEIAQLEAAMEDGS